MRKLVLLLFLPGSLRCSSEPREEAVQEPVARPAAQSVWVSKDQTLTWKSWEAFSFQQARERNCPVLLYLAAPGCEGIFAGRVTAVRSLLEERFVAIRVDPFQRPDIARRYAAGGWPSLAVLMPDGRAFAMAVDVPPGNVELFLWRILTSYEKQRATIEHKLRQAEREQSRAMVFEVGVAEVYEAVSTAFDTLHGGFGQDVKFAEVAVLRFLLDYYAESRDQGVLEMVKKSLDALLSSPLHDLAGGGYYAYSHTPDWQTPALEKDGLDQAGLVLVLLEAAEYGSPGYTVAASALIEYIETYLFEKERGVFRGRQVGVRSGAGVKSWWTDPAVYADRNALLIRACAAAALHLQDERAARMARAAGRFLLQHCIDAEGAVFHLYADGRGQVPGLLDDQVLVSAALLDLYEMSGEERFRRQAQRTISFIERYCFDPVQQAFFDRPAAADLEGIARRRLFPYRDGMLPAGNVLAAEVYLRLGDLAQAGILLSGKRLRQKPDRASSSHARAVLLYERARRRSL